MIPKRRLATQILTMLEAVRGHQGAEQLTQALEATTADCACLSCAHSVIQIAPARDPKFLFPTLAACKVFAAPRREDSDLPALVDCSARHQSSALAGDAGWPPEDGSDLAGEQHRPQRSGEASASRG